jgi:hypothetical protein
VDVPPEEARLRELAAVLLRAYVDPALEMLSRFRPLVDAAQPNTEVRAVSLEIASGPETLGEWRHVVRGHNLKGEW